MTLVNHETGEIIETLTESDARRLTGRIKLLAEGIADQVEKMAALIDEARVGSAWLALGYSSWTAYISAEFAGVMPRLDREPRREFVRELSARGMSTRAIAPVVGVGDSTVQRDLAGAPDGAPRPNPNAESDARARIAARENKARDRAHRGLDKVIADMGIEEPTVEVATVTGLDGKTYSQKPKVKPTERDLSNFIESDTSIADGRYLVALMKELGKVAAVHQFDPARIAAAADDTTFAAIDAAFENFAQWREQVKAKRNGLRVIKGGAQ